MKKFMSLLLTAAMLSGNAAMPFTAIAADTAAEEHSLEAKETKVKRMDLTDFFALQSDPTAVSVKDYEEATPDDVFTELCGGEYVGVCSYNKDFFMHTGTDLRTLMDENGKLHTFYILYPEVVVQMQGNFKLSMDNISNALAKKGYKAPKLAAEENPYRLYGCTTQDEFGALLEILQDLHEAGSVTGHLAIYEDTINSISADGGINIGLPYEMDENSEKYKELIEVASSVGYTVGTADSAAPIGDYQLSLRKDDAEERTNPYKLFKYLEDNGYLYSTSVISTCLALVEPIVYFCNISYPVTEYAMTLTIVETRGDTLILKPDAPYLQNIGDRISLPAKCLDDGVIPPVGTRLEVTYSGGILETYPAQFGGIKKVRVLSEPAKTVKGDANLDEQTDMADVVLIMQALANPDKYGENGQAYIHLTTFGKLSADMNGDGLTVGDAQAVQEQLLGIDEAEKSFSAALLGIDEGKITGVKVTSSPKGYDYSFTGDKAKTVVDYLSNLSLSSELSVADPGQLNGMLWVIALEYEDGETVTLYDSGRFIHSESGQWYEMPYEESEGFSSLVWDLGK
ncbi:hypothetical protein [Ruminococcus flavefaciens]|uniref:hypothetical protein n=1 Tax=Ruminococcus flavefaciens TaxID=1265 RepID=UPI0026F1E822|nr:hypothetical protein [Ruminococcus flavefaciens]